MVTGHCESPCRVFVTIRGKRKGNWYKIVERYLKILLDKVTLLSTFLHAGNVQLKLGRNVERWSKIILHEIVNAFD